MAKNFSDERLYVKRIIDRFENCNAFNVYTNIFLVIVGFVANLLALPILVYSKNRTPRIVGVNYLIIFTIANVLYLVVSFYINTYNRLIYYFDLDYEKSWQFFDSCTALCKMLPYFRYSTRSVNTMLTVGFSLERFIAVFRPLQMRALKWKFCIALKASIVISFILPAYLPFLVELVPNEEANILQERYNLTTGFSIYSWMPFFGQYTCAPKKAYYTLLLKFHFLIFLVTLVSYLVIGITILAIVIKLKKRHKYIFRDRSNPNPDSYNLAILSSDSSKNEQSYQTSRNKKDHSKFYNCCFYLCNKIAVPKNQSRQCLLTSKKQDTRILTSVSVSFVFCNTPFFLIMLLILAFSVHSIELNENISVDDLATIINFRCALVISEIFQIANFSVTGFIFFFSGKAFRFHALMFFKNIFNQCPNV